MKKQRFVFLLAVFVIILTGCSASVKTIHNFELRNGVRFGDDVATIKQNEVLEPAGNENDLVYKGEIAQKEGYVKYHLDKEKGLYDLEYFYENLSKSVWDKQYQFLRNSLVEKYGDPLATSEKLRATGDDNSNYDILVYNVYSGIEQTFITADMIERALSKQSTYYHKDYTIDIADEWIIKTDGYYVKIDLLKFSGASVGWSSIDYDYHLGISYHYLSNEDYAVVKENKSRKEKDEQTRIENEHSKLNNDL